MNILMIKIFIQRNVWSFKTTSKSAIKKTQVNKIQSVPHQPSETVITQSQFFAQN